MLGVTHAVIGAAVGLSITDSLPLTGLTVLGSLLPDIDKGTSLLGRYNPTSFLIPHRTVTHSLVFMILCYVISPVLAIGVLTHYILDMLNPSGIQLLFPVPIKIHFPIIGNFDSGGAFDHLLLVGSIGFLLYTAVGGGTGWI